MKRTDFFIGASIITLLTSCAPNVPFTHAIREKYNLGEEQLKAIQFYPSHHIILTRGESQKSEQGTEGGKLTIKSGKYEEQVVIKMGTPGVVDKVLDKNRIAVSFESGENTYLIFGAPNPSTNERYTMLAESWEGTRGKIQYGGKNYYTQPGSGDAYLVFKMKKLNKYIRKQRVAKGRKI